MSDVLDDDLLKELGLDEEPALKPEIKKTPEVTTQAEAAPKPEVPPAAPAKKAPQVSETAPQVPRVKEETSKSDSFTQNIPVQLAAVLAKKTLTLGQVLNLRAGEVIELNLDKDEPIDLVANGKLVAKASLVMIEGKVGVRVLKLIR